MKLLEPLITSPTIYYLRGVEEYNWNWYIKSYNYKGNIIYDFIEYYE